MSNGLVNPRMTFGEMLRFSPYAWAKLIWMRDRGNTEVAGYCVTGTSDPLLITDFCLVKQECTGCSFDLDPDDGAEYMERKMDEGLMPWQYSNILAHTHPGNSPSPSPCDETNFRKAFAHPNWAIMFILANGGDVYCRLKVNVGPGVIKEMDVYVDWNQPFSGSSVVEWEKEYKEKVTEKKWTQPSATKTTTKSVASMSSDEVDAWLEQHQTDTSSHRDIISQKADSVEEEASDAYEIDCFWDNNGDVVFWDEEGTTYSYDPIGGKWYTEETDDMTGAVVEIQPDNSPIFKQVVRWAVKNANDRADAIVDAAPEFMEN